MAIKIISKRAGFRRCGIEHPDTPVIYPTSRFTEEQLAQLQAEPMLIVEEVPDEPTKEAKAGGRTKGDKAEASADGQ
jgi:hypothetical protein